MNLPRGLQVNFHSEHVADVVKATPLAAFIGTALAWPYWATLSYALASVYSVMLIVHFLVKRVALPLRDWWHSRGRA